MLTYTFSRREKTLLLVLALVVIAVIWYVVVFQSTTNAIASINSETAAVQEQTAIAQAQAMQMDRMQQTIDQDKAEGAKPKPLPEYDNIQPLMEKLDDIMGSTGVYELNFEELDTESTEYVLRPVSITFGCHTYKAAEKVVRDLTTKAYSCIVDSVSISDSSTLKNSRVIGAVGRNGSYEVNGVIHVIFLERPQQG